MIGPTKAIKKDVKKGKTGATKGGKVNSRYHVLMGVLGVSTTQKRSRKSNTRVEKGS